MFSLIRLILQTLITVPALYKIIKEVGKVFEEIVREYEEKKLKEELEKAKQEAKETKNTTKYEEILGGKKKNKNETTKKNN